MEPHDLALATPAAPRPVPPEVQWRLRFSRNPWALLGFAFTVPLLCTVCLPLVGLPMLIYGLLAGSARVRTLRWGHPVRGRVTAVEVDESLALQDRHPLRVRYAFDTPWGRMEGAWSTWDARARELAPGDEIAIVYLPSGSSAPWPPMS